MTRTSYDQNPAMSSELPPMTGQMSSAADQALRDLARYTLEVPILSPDVPLGLYADDVVNGQKGYTHAEAYGEAGVRSRKIIARLSVAAESGLLPETYDESGRPYDAPYTMDDVSVDALKLAKNWDEAADSTFNMADVEKSLLGTRFERKKQEVAASGLPQRASKGQQQVSAVAPRPRSDGAVDDHIAALKAANDVAQFRSSVDPSRATRKRRDAGDQIPAQRRQEVQPLVYAAGGRRQLTPRGIVEWTQGAHDRAGKMRLQATRDAHQPLTDSRRVIREGKI